MQANQDVYVNADIPKIDKQDIVALSKLRPYYSLVVIALDWGMVIASVALTEMYFSWAAYVLCVLFLGSRYHAFGVLLHEAAHYRLTRNRKLNDWAGEILLAWPILVTLYGYRQNHFKHHRHTNTMEDPDWLRKLNDPYFVYPVSREKLWLYYLKAITGLRFFSEARLVLKSKEMNDVPSSLKKMRLVFFCSVLLLFWYLNALSLLFFYWIVPLVTSYAFVMYIRGVAEHHGGGMEYNNLLSGTRHVEANWLERIFFPHHVNYHLDHHLYPSVPYYHLPKLHKKMLEIAEYREKAHITKGYLSGFYKECLAR